MGLEWPPGSGAWLDAAISLTVAGTRPPRSAGSAGQGEHRIGASRSFPPSEQSGWRGNDPSQGGQLGPGHETCLVI
ncbi:MAG: hypothetical protein CBC48_00590 [bacterium TMED88]|nr:MAG: hypothetical protein CBC48_00590 [bacterium TMED88]